jgi:hypothetical protein
MGDQSKPDIAALMQLPEVQKALAEAAAKGAALAVGEISKQSGGVPTDSMALFSGLAAAIAEISMQGRPGPKPVPPEVARVRREAHEHCVKLVLKARKESHEPEYRLVAKVYLNERIIEPYRKLPDKRVVSQEIVWTGLPNEAMVPVNDVAREIYHAYKESIGSVELIPTLDNRPVWVTNSGLVVKGDPPKRAFVAAPHEFDDRLGVKHDNNNPTEAYVRVLGTTFPPAKQNVDGASQNTAAAG